MVKSDPFFFRGLKKKNRIIEEEEIKEQFVLITIADFLVLLEYVWIRHQAVQNSIIASKTPNNKKFIHLLGLY